MRYKIRGELTPATHLSIFDGIDADTDETIVLDIHSHGGDTSVLHYAMNILNRAKRQGKRIVTCNSGVALSAGATLLFKGDEIYVGDTSITMLHMSRFVFDSLMDMFMMKMDRFIRWIKGERITQFTEISDEILMSYEPWDEILEHFQDKKIRGDYYLGPQAMAALFPRAKVEDMPEMYAEMDLWSEGEEMILDPSSLPPDVQAAIAEAMDEQ